MDIDINDSEKIFVVSILAVLPQHETNNNNNNNNVGVGRGIALLFHDRGTRRG